MRPQTFITLLLFVAACADNSAGTSTGNPSPNEDAGPDGGEHSDTGGLAEGGYCEAGDSTDFALDAQTPLGFAGEDILAFALGAHEETMRWGTPMSTTFGPESGEQEVTITIEHDGSEVRYVEPAEPGSGAEIALIDLEGAQCHPWLEIDVHVTIETSGGALDESFDAVLRSHNALAASLYAHPDPDTLNGSFTASHPTEGFNLAQLDLSITLSPFGTSGTFSGVFEKRSDDAVSAGFGDGPFATFGRASCQGGGFAVGLDDEVRGHTAREGLDVLAASDSVTLTWEDASTSTSTFAFASGTDGACVLLDNLAVGDVTLFIDGTLTMKSEDGRLDAEWPGRVEVDTSDDEGAIVTTFSLADGFPSHTMPGASVLYGFPNEDISGFDAAGVYVTVWSSTGTDATGEVSLTGYTFADCASGTDTDEPPPDAPDAGERDGSGGAAGGSVGGSPGCAGADPTIVARATF